MSIFGLFSKGVSSAGTVTYNELTEALESGAVALVDVREPHEYASGHAPEAINLPLSHFDPAALPADKPVVLVCQAGARSARALAAARAAGRNDVSHYPGGMNGWRMEGGEVVL